MAGTRGLGLGPSLNVWFRLGSGAERGWQGIGLLGACVCGHVCEASCNLLHLCTVVYCVTNLGFKEPQTSGCSSWVLVCVCVVNG